MTTSGQRGHLSFALGATPIGSGVPSETSPVLDGDYFWTQPFTSATLAPQEFVSVLEPELGNTLFTRGGYKSGVYMGGNATMEVRLAKYFGKFLQGLSRQGAPSFSSAVASDTTTNAGTVHSGLSASATTLVLSGATSVVVGDILMFSSALSGEKVLVVDKTDNNTYTIARGYGGTAPAAINNGDTVTRKARNGVTRFMPNPANEVSVPVAHARRYVPDSAGTGGYTEYGFDGMFSSLMIAIPQMGAAKAEVNALFRRPYAIDGEVTGTIVGENLTYSTPIRGILEDPKSLALSSIATVSLPSLGVYTMANAAFMGGQVMLGNIPITPQEGMVVGSYHPEDWTVLSRGGTLRLMYKWKDEALYNKIAYGNDFGDWSPSIFYSDVLLTMTSPGISAGVAAKPYELTLHFPNVALQMTAPTLQAGRFLSTELAGTVVAPTSGPLSGWSAFMFNDVTYNGL